MTTAADCVTAAFYTIYETHDSVLKTHMTVHYQILLLISRRDSKNYKINFYILHQTTASNRNFPCGISKLNYKRQSTENIMMKKVEV